MTTYICKCIDCENNVKVIEFSSNTRKPKMRDLEIFKNEGIEKIVAVMTEKETNKALERAHKFQHFYLAYDPLLNRKYNEETLIKSEDLDNLFEDI